MKRILVATCALACLLFGSVFQSYAFVGFNPTEGEAPEDCISWDAYSKHYDTQYTHLGLSYYVESYYHYESTPDESPVDWVIVSVQYYELDWYYPGKSLFAVIDDYVYGIDGSQPNYPFTFGYAVYDVRKDKFIDVMYADFNEYIGLDEYIKNHLNGRPIGDVDGDRKLTVKDATFIQKVIAGIGEFYPANDLTEAEFVRGEIKYISDFNRDGINNVKDATAIQKRVAEIE